MQHWANIQNFKARPIIIAQICSKIFNQDPIRDVFERSGEMCVAGDHRAVLHELVYLSCVMMQAPREALQICLRSIERTDANQVHCHHLNGLLVP